MAQYSISGKVFVFEPGNLSGVTIVLENILHKLGSQYKIKKTLAMRGSSTYLCFHVKLVEGGKKSWNGKPNLLVLTALLRKKLVGLNCQKGNEKGM